MSKVLSVLPVPVPDAVRFVEAVGLIGATAIFSGLAGIGLVEILRALGSLSWLPAPGPSLFGV